MSDQLDDEYLEKIIDEAPRRTNGLPTAADIINMVLPEPVWIVPEYFPAGLAILAARPKFGKSWLGLQLSRAVSAGGRFFDQPVTRGAVLYLALEDSVRRLKSRMEKQGWKAEDSHNANFLTFEDFRKFIGPLNKGGTARLEGLILANQYRLVVIDTLSRAFTGVKDMNESQEVTAALAPIQVIAIQNEISILLIDHHNKPKGYNPDPVDDVMGSTAKGAVADTILGMYSENGKRGAILKGRGREIEPIDKRIYFDGLTGAWQIEGDTVELRTTEKQNEILTALRNLGRSKASSVAVYLGENRGNTATRLEAMYSKELVTCEVIEGVRYYAIPENI